MPLLQLSDILRLPVSCVRLYRIYDAECDVLRSVEPISIAHVLNDFVQGLLIYEVNRRYCLLVDLPLRRRDFVCSCRGSFR